MIQEAKRTGGEILVLDAGDLLFYKDVQLSLPDSQKKEALLKAQLIIDAFNLMGCDAVGIGEDELRLGTRDFKKLKKKATFPFVSANVVRKSGRRISDSVIVKKAGGLRWGIFSLMGANPSAQAQTLDWKVLDPVSTGKEVVKELQGKVDVIVLLAAMPLQELRALLPLVPGITIAVAGHNPSGLRRSLQVEETIIVSSYAYGKYLGVLKLNIGNPQAPFVDEARITALERELTVVEDKIKAGAKGSFAESKKKMEAELQELKKSNTYRNELIMLSSRFSEDPQVQKLITDFSAKQKELQKGCQ
ncbi:MAG: bifunctional metallophosphatase/5'-nucleotidase [Deltaproteobacteria bacterium]|nr:bifunctional metallophosphatase/5'-nucleotidase [Deltaproteobacteria bacterium]